MWHEALQMGSRSVIANELFGTCFNRTQGLLMVMSHFRSSDVIDGNRPNS